MLKIVKYVSEKKEKPRKDSVILCQDVKYEIKRVISSNVITTEIIDAMVARKFCRKIDH